MKVMQMNCWLKSGSTGKIVYAIQNYVRNKGDKTYAIYGLGEKSASPNELRTTPELIRKAQSFRSRITGYPYGGCIWGTETAIRFIKKVEPDIVHIHCINGYMVSIYKILDFLKNNHIPTVITNHAEFMYTGGCTHAVECDKWKTGCFLCSKLNAEHPITYFFDRTANEWNLMRKAYDGFEKLYICNVSDWLTNRARMSPFFKGYPVETVFNGLDTTIFRYIPNSATPKARPLVIHVTSNFYDKIKGGQHVIEMSKRCPDADFIVVGSEVKSGVEIPKNIKFSGQIPHQRMLSKLYSSADLCLLTSLREAFSMVTAESLCCGTPVVGFKAGGPESIALKEYSNFVNQNDDAALEKALREMLAKKYRKEDISNKAISKYSEEKMCQQYYKIYKKLLDNRENFN